MIKDFSFKKLLLVWLLTTLPILAQPNSPFSEGEEPQGKHYQNLWIGGGFNAGGIDFLSNGRVKIFGDVLFHGTEITWGLNWGNTTLFEEDSLNLFRGNVPVIKIGTYVNESYKGGEVYIAGEDKLTYFGGGINVSGGIQFKYYLDIISADDIPEDHPAELITSGDQPFSYLTTDANIVDLFRDNNITNIYLGGVGTDIRIGGGTEDDFIISPSTNSISSAAVGGTVHLFNDNGVTVQIGAEDKNTEIMGNLVVHGNYNFLGHNIGPYNPSEGGTGTGGTFTGMWPTHYEGAWKITFTAETPQIRAETNEYTYLFSEKFTSSYFTGGDPLLGVLPGLELDLSYRTGLIIGNVSDVSIGNPNRITRLFGTVYFDGGVNFESGVTWGDAVLSGTTTFNGPINIVEGEVEDDDRMDYQLAIYALNEGEGETYTSYQDPAFESQYETNPSFDAQKGLIKIAEALDVSGGLVKLTNLPTEEPTGEQNEGALWVDDGALMVAPGISAPIPKVEWYYVGEGEGEPYDFVIYAKDASERSPDDPEGEGEPIFEAPAGEGEYPYLTYDVDNPGVSIEGEWLVLNFGNPDDSGTPRNVDGGITTSYTIGKEILSKLREDTLIIEFLPPPVEVSIAPSSGSLPLLVTITNDTIEGPVEAYSWSLEVYTIGGEGENEYLLENEGEIDSYEFYLLDSDEGEGEYEGEGLPWHNIGTISSETEVVFRLTGVSLINDAYADVDITLYPTVE